MQSSGREQKGKGNILEVAQAFTAWPVAEMRPKKLGYGNCVASGR